MAHAAASAVASAMAPAVASAVASRQQPKTPHTHRREWGRFKWDLVGSGTSRTDVRNEILHAARRPEPMCSNEQPSQISPMKSLRLEIDFGSVQCADIRRVRERSLRNDTASNKRLHELDEVRRLCLGLRERAVKF